MFTDKDYGKPIKPELVEYLKMARQEDFREVGRKIERSSETIKSLARGDRNLLKKNEDCVVELIRHIESKVAPVRKEINKILSA